MAFQDEEALAMEQGHLDGSVSEEEYAEWGDYRIRLLAARGGGLELVLKQERVILQTLQEEGTEGKVGFADVNQLSYLFEDDEDQMVYAMVFLAVSILAITRLFGMEYQGMQPLLASTANGRQSLRGKKMLQSLLFLTVLYVILYLPYSCFLYLLGVDLSGWTCVGGFLPELVYRNGNAAALLVKMGAVLAMDAVIAVLLLREKK